MWFRTRRDGGSWRAVGTGRQSSRAAEGRVAIPRDCFGAKAPRNDSCDPTVCPPVRLSIGPSARPSAGFTLIEILVVITVIAILASLVTPMVFRNVGDAKASTTRAQIEILGLALDTYRLDNDYYPSTAQGLDALRTLPTGEPSARNWRGPYLKKSVPPDPYGRRYIYRSPGEANPGAYDLLSLGRDGQPGGAGEDADVTSWDENAR